jgi:hypothetical protein
VYLSCSGANQGSNKEYLQLQTSLTRHTINVPSKIRNYINNKTLSDIKTNDQGILAEFDMAYLFINTKLFVWELNQNSEIVPTEDMKDEILAVGVVRTPKGYFRFLDSHLLAVGTRTGLKLLRFQGTRWMNENRAKFPFYLDNT